MFGLHLLAAGKMEREMGAGGFVIRAEQGDAITAAGALQVGPIAGIPGELQAHGAVKALGPLHVLHPQGHMTEPGLPAQGAPLLLAAGGADAVDSLLAYRHGALAVALTPFLTATGSCVAAGPRPAGPGAWGAVP